MKKYWYFLTPAEGGDYERRAYSRPKVEALIEIAEKAGLDHAVGRACYAMNRSMNGGMKGREMLEVMTSARVETARRWAAHYRSGGSLKVISRSKEEERAAERKREEARKAERAKWRLKK
jgi:hypothetical protein